MVNKLIERKEREAELINSARGRGARQEEVIRVSDTEAFQMAGIKVKTVKKNGV